MKAEFNSIGKQITLRADLSSLSARDRLTLMQQLMNDFGLLDRLLLDASCKTAIQHIEAVIQENW